MPIEAIPGTDLTYHLIAFDAKGRERTDDPDGVMTRRSLEALRDEPITDVFLLSHGWMGDVPAARDQYRRWIGAMAGCDADRTSIRAKRPGFRALAIGLHWPSLPWGDSSLAAASFAVPTGDGTPEVDPIEALIDEAADRIVDTPAARAALRVIAEASMEDVAPPRLPPDVRAAYAALDRETGLGADSRDDAPGDDRAPFDPEGVYQASQDDAMSSFGGGFGEGLLAPLRTLSFWKMKDRARQLGEGSGHQFLADLRREADGSGRDVRIHLMGHSFGCVVVSSMVCGPAGSPVVPIDSLSLIQGAMSHWSYCSDIPVRPGHAGYFRRLLDGRVRGPILTTQSSLDSAVGRWYPWAAGVARQVDFAPGEFPKFGALGAFGAQGPGIDVVSADLLDADGVYEFAAGKVYNLDGDRFICHGGGFTGAHNDIDNPQVAHAVWQAAGA